ncbi:MAG: RrF2 family transcriptional regulator [Bryobacteraceae bacterium]
MITKTSLSAIRALMYISRHEEEGPVSPRRIGQDLNESPTYMAKVTRHLVRAGILRAEKGVKGGVRLSRPAQEITMLEVVQACQGKLLADYCLPVSDMSSVCGYHKAAAELHGAICGVLSRWTLAQLLKKPISTGKKAGGMGCVILSGISPAVFSIGGVPPSIPEG